MIRAHVVAFVVMVVCSGCTSQQAAPSDRDSEPGTELSTTPADPSPQLPRAIRVDVVSRVGASPEATAFAAYVRARTASFLAGSATPSLRLHTTGRELRRQQGLVTSAVESGFTVPAQPRVALVGRQRVASDATVLGVCLYLPSTEYVDAITGDSPYGDVPQRWQAAVVRLVSSPVTWKVDKVVPPPKAGGPNCRGLD